jgi:5'-nucleotidase
VVGIDEDFLEIILNILLTNDDGINSPGLWIMAESLLNLGRVTIVVPDRDQSGMGASMTLLRPLTMQKVGTRNIGVEAAYTVDGTPADCVIMATERICENPVDLIVSGINPGANLGLDVFNSGTFGAALHGYFRGIDSIAVSSKYDGDVIYGPSSAVGAAIAEVVLQQTNDVKMLLNINLPPHETSGIKGVEITRLGPKAYLEGVEEFTNGRRNYYWLKHTKKTDESVEIGTDVWAVDNDRVSISIINPYLVSYECSSVSDQFASAAISSLGCIL